MTATTATPADFEKHGFYEAKGVPISDAVDIPRKYVFNARVTADGSSGHPAEPGRYHLYVVDACPWSQRVAIALQLSGLEDVVSVSRLDPIRDGRGWAFRAGAGDDGGAPDPIAGRSFLSEVYEFTQPDYEGPWSVPTLVERDTGRIVSNDPNLLAADLETQFRAHAEPTHELFPEELRPKILEFNDLLYENLNNLVYKAGFARNQKEFNEFSTQVFVALDAVERRLATQRYLFGDRLTDSDLRLWVTLARFDAVYATHFKLTRRRIVDLPNVWAYARDIYSIPAVRATTQFEVIKRHYYTTHPWINPSGIVPDGPDVDWDAPHNREGLSV